MTRTALIVLSCLALASCAPPGSGAGGGAGDARLRAACNAAADRVYEAQHRAEIFAPMSEVNSPQSSTYAAGADGRGLSQLFGRQNDVDQCVRSGGNPAAAATGAPPPAR